MMDKDLLIGLVLGISVSLSIVAIILVLKKRGGYATEINRDEQGRIIGVYEYPIRLREA